METTGYMLIGFAVIFGILLLHLASLAWRDQNFNRDLRMFESLGKADSKKKTNRKRKLRK
jgi:hypothetical protein